MAPVTIFSSAQAQPQVRIIAQDMSAKGHNVQSLAQLPAPLPARLSALRLEQAELQQDERIISWLLSQYADGLLLPDACHENGLRADLDATAVRLRAVRATLNALKGNLHHD